MYDWSCLYNGNGINFICDTFVSVVQQLIHKHIAIKIVRLSKKDPTYVTPLIKNLLNIRNILRRLGDTVEADNLAKESIVSSMVMLGKDSASWLTPELMRCGRQLNPTIGHCLTQE